MSDSRAMLWPARARRRAPRAAHKTLRKILDAALGSLARRGFQRQLDRRHHQPRQGRAWHLLYVFRQQGGGVRGAGAATCRAGCAIMSPRC